MPGFKGNHGFSFTIFKMTRQASAGSARPQAEAMRASLESRCLTWRVRHLLLNVIPSGFVRLDPHSQNAISNGVHPRGIVPSQLAYHWRSNAAPQHGHRSLLFWFINTLPSLSFLYRNYSSIAALLFGAVFVKCFAIRPVIDAPSVKV